MMSKHNGNLVSCYVCNKSKITRTLHVDFRHRCGVRLEKLGNVEMKSGNYDDAVEYFLTALSHNDEGALQLAASSLTPDTLLIKWASVVLLRGSVNDALATATKVCCIP